MTLFDGNAVEGAALYVAEILGLELDDSLVKNIFGKGGINIYYMDWLPGNSYLASLTYDLNGGGQLIPMRGVPEPTTILYLCVGILGLAGLNRKRLKMQK